MNQWLEDLKVGDVVCDCRYKHLKVKEIFEERYPPRWFYRLTMFLPFRLPYILDDWYLNTFKGVLWDKHLTLEDGNMCSAINCCWPADNHKESSHYE